MCLYQALGLFKREKDTASLPSGELKHACTGWEGDQKFPKTKFLGFRERAGKFRGWRDHIWLGREYYEEGTFELFIFFS